LVKVVYLEQGHDARTAIPVEPEVAVARAKHLDPVVIRRGQFRGASKAISRPNVWVKNRTALA